MHVSLTCVTFREVTKTADVVRGKEMIKMCAPCGSALAVARTILRRESAKLRLTEIGKRLTDWFGGVGLAGRLTASSGDSRAQAPVRLLSRKARLLRFEIVARCEMVGSVRQRVSEFARMLPFTDQEVEDIRLAVSEAVVNAIQHGWNPKWPKVGIEMRANGNRLRVAVWDHGPGFDPRNLCPTAECLVERGRGIFFMRTLMDEVRFRCTKHGTRVEMTKLASGALQPAQNQGSHRKGFPRKRHRT